MLKVGIIGYGAIGRDVAKYIVDGDAGEVSLEAVLVRNKAKVRSDLTDGIVIDQTDEFFQKSLDIIVEGAGHEAVRLYAERALLKGCDLIVSSVGAFCDDQLYKTVQQAAKTTGKRLIIPSCAIGGLDRIAAGAVGPMDEVTLTSRKPPKAWRGTIVEQQLDLANMKEPVCVFEGPARECARIFPESVNVSAAVSLAGIGFDKTRVRVFVDPTIIYNTHEITASGKFGEIRLEIRNTPSDNPKTGWIAAMSIAKALRNLTGSVVIGL